MRLQSAGHVAAVDLRQSHPPYHLPPLLVLLVLVWTQPSVHGVRKQDISHPSRCAHGCLTHGTCNEELGRCDCPRHLGGPDCSQHLPLRSTCKRYGFDVQSCLAETPGHCLNNCTSQGRCMAGWCHCLPGYFGADCSLSLGPNGRPQLLVGAYQPASSGPAIYVYEVPPRFNTWRNIEKFDRPLYAHVWKRILSSGHRTLDPNTADYFYIPADFRYLFQDAIEVLRYVRTTWSHWNRTGGAHHLLLSTSDLGGCEGAQLMRIRNLTAQATWITAWGLTRKHPHVWWPGCHRPGLDIVIPIPAQTPGMLLTPLNVAVAHKPPRNITFFFAGKVCGDNKDPKPPGSPWPICQTRTNPLYSAGMRQQVYAHHSARPGYRIVARSPSYIEDMSRAQFCLAPTGGGHGKRQVLVARFGCIPVPITDFVMQPFEPELPWSEFSVSVPEADVPRMHTILEAITPAKLTAMQAAVVCASRHMWWSTMWGGIFGEDGRYDAFATLMELLAARLRHPGVPPEDLLRVDKRWAQFARCELGDDTAAAQALLAASGMHVSGPVSAPSSSSAVNTTPLPALCSYGRDEDLRHLAVNGFCETKQWGKYGSPGGAVCDGRGIARCPRP